MTLRGFLVALLVTTSFLAISSPVSVATANRATQPPKVILKSAARDTAKLESYRFRGIIRDATGRINLTGDAVAPDRLRLTMRQGRGVSRLLLLPSTAYMNLNGPAWRATGTQNPKKFANRWLSFPATPNDPSSLSAGFAEASPRLLALCMFGRTGTLSRGGMATIAGQRAVVIIDRGNRRGTTPRRLYIAASGPARLLRAVQTGRSRGKVNWRCRDQGDTTRWMDVRFGGFNQELSIEPPRSSTPLVD